MEMLSEKEQFNYFEAAMQKCLVINNEIMQELLICKGLKSLKIAFTL